MYITWKCDPKTFKIRKFLDRNVLFLLHSHYTIYLFNVQFRKIRVNLRVFLTMLPQLLINLFKFIHISIYVFLYRHLFPNKAEPFETFSNAYSSRISEFSKTSLILVPFKTREVFLSTLNINLILRNWCALKLAQKKLTRKKLTRFTNFAFNFSMKSTWIQQIDFKIYEINANLRPW